MSNEQKGIEIKVGLFVFVGLMAIGAMSVYFGRVGQAFVSYYRITVEFPNATGLHRNEEVQLNGAHVGAVAIDPVITPGKISSVSVKLDIQNEIKIPIGSRFAIASSGLLGDKFIQITLPKDFDQSKFNSSNPQEIYRDQAMISGYSSSEPDGLAKVLENLNMQVTALNLKANQLISRINKTSKGDPATQTNSHE